MLKIITYSLSRKIKSSVLSLLRKLPLFYYRFFDFSVLLLSLPYAFFGWSFRRERAAVLAGRAVFARKLTIVTETSFQLRRNIHRIEKGLVMKSRRGVFAEEYIEETVNLFEKALGFEASDQGEIKWAEDVLHAFFRQVERTALIESQNIRFSILVSEVDESYVPYLQSDRMQTQVSYDDLLSLAHRRRSIRWYEKREVPMSLVTKAVGLAALAPSACNRQPFYFYSTNDKTKVYDIVSCAMGTAGWGENVPCVVAVVGDLSAFSEARDRHSIYVDGSLATMQFLLALETLGLSSCVINWPDIESRERRLRSLLGIKIYERPIMLVAVGYAAGDGGIPYSKKRDVANLLKVI